MILKFIEIIEIYAFDACRLLRQIEIHVDSEFHTQIILKRNFFNFLKKLLLFDHKYSLKKL